MRGSLLLLAVCGAMLACGSAHAVEPRAKAGWFGVFPSLPNYSLSYQPPVVTTGKDATTYHQDVQYDWMGNNFRQVKATLARNPAFKMKYSAETMKQEKAIEIVVGKKTGWLRMEGREAVVPLADDKALILTAVEHFGQDELVELAGLFDLTRAEEALFKAPRTEVKRDKAMFRGLPKDALWWDLLDWAGVPDKTKLKDKLVEGADYKLLDDSTIHLSLKEGKLTGVTFTDKDGKLEDLALAISDDASPGGIEWNTLFPKAPPGFALIFDSPVIAKGDKPAAYRLTAHYDWTGNDIRSATATMARDPEFKTKYSAEAMRKELHKEITVGKKTAWLLLGDGAGVKPQWELIVPLAEDKALILTARGHYDETGLKALAESFDLEKVEAALAKPPRTK